MGDKKKWLVRIALSLAIYCVSSYVLEALYSAVFKVSLAELASYTTILGIDILGSWLLGSWLTKKFFND